MRRVAQGTSKRDRKLRYSLVPTKRELERAHAFFNRSLFGRKLSNRVLVTILPAEKKKAHGWYRARTWKQGRVVLAELNIAAEDLNRPVEQVLETLIHEMCHQKNVEVKIEDTCDQGRYHNERFKEAAEAAGLVCRRNNHGWALTQLGPRALQAISRFKPNRKLFRLARFTLLGRPKAPTKQKKWSCACDYAIRIAIAKPTLWCITCDSPVVKKDE